VTIHENQLLFMTWSDTDAPRGGVTNYRLLQVITGYYRLLQVITGYEYNLSYVHPFHTWE
jgi:hypothetical protein